MVWNLRGQCGGLHYKNGGVVHWRSRLDKIIEKIEAEDPDVLVLQEIDDTALAEALIQRLGGRYAHLFTHLGANAWGSSNGCMILTKCAIHNFTHANFSDSDWTRPRGLEIFEIKASPRDTSPCVRIIASSLAPGKEEQTKRMEQFSQIVNALAARTLALPTLFVSNINADRDHPDEGTYLSKHLYHSYRGDEPTHTDQLASQWTSRFTAKGEMIDFISLFKRNLPDGRTMPVIEKGIRVVECRLVKAFDETYNTKNSLSDHHGVFTLVGGLKPATP
jgi:endonuclease/exonuclease/phosphatase family metal-dependent hydrolase